MTRTCFTRGLIEQWIAHRNLSKSKIRDAGGDNAMHILVIVRLLFVRLYFGQSTDMLKFKHLSNAVNGSLSRGTRVNAAPLRLRGETRGTCKQFRSVTAISDSGMSKSPLLRERGISRRCACGRSYSWRDSELLSGLHAHGSAGRAFHTSPRS